MTSTDVITLLDVLSAVLALSAGFTSFRYTLKSHRRLSGYPPEDAHRPVALARRRTKALLTFTLFIIFLGAIHHIFPISPYVLIGLRYALLIAIMRTMRLNERDLGAVMPKPVPAGLVYPPKE